ncbi:DUF4829 domain-containing protein [Hathewaya massiliensis]|uniref:DUF4829 domain-containing protein n=1 Tax=Hathewaya massiliensis TaxID=1964382 RepID=UPI001FA9C19C|nr:DUF4829 domain-containing protein [Hathewaya massiliensis]
MFVILLVFSLVGCNQKSNDKEMVKDNEASISDKLVTNIGNSDKFDKQEIENAMKVVKYNFDFPASTLTRICYNEEKSDKLIKTYLENGRDSVNGAKPENVIVLLTNFDVDDSGDNPVFNAGSTYEDYQWILIRNNKNSNWIIDDSGY